MRGLVTEPKCALGEESHEPHGQMGQSGKILVAACSKNCKHNSVYNNNPVSGIHEMAGDIKCTHYPSCQPPLACMFMIPGKHGTSTRLACLYLLPDKHGTSTTVTFCPFTGLGIYKCSGVEL